MLRLTVLTLFLVLEYAVGWEEVAGSCLGPASEHIPADAGAGWGQPGPYSIKIDGITRGGTVCGDTAGAGCTTLSMGTMHILRTGRRTVNKPEKHARRDDDVPSGCWSGHLIKALDAATGLPLPAFASTPLPRNTALFPGCTDPLSAVTHEGETGFCAPFSLNITWPSDQDVAIQAFLFADETEWYEIYGSNAATWVAAELDCPRERLSIPAIIVGFAPIVIIFLCAVIVKFTPGLRSLSSFLNQTGSAARVPNLPALVSLLSFDVVSTCIEMSVGEWLAFVVFFGCQIASLVLSSVFINNSAIAANDGEGGTVTLSPWDASFARAIGHLLMVNMANTCFLPTRNSALALFSGVSFERMVRYHRVVGRFTFLLVVLHGALHLQFWGFGDCFSTRPICFGYNNLWGSLSGILFIISMVGAFDTVRRTFFEVFLISHFLVVPAMVFACLHATDFLYFLIAPAALYVIDFALRIFQQMRRSSVTQVQVFEGGIVKLEIECPAIARALYDRKEGGLGVFVFVRCWQASLNPLDLHPFTISGHLMDPAHGIGPTSPSNPAMSGATADTVVSAPNGNGASSNAILASAGKARGITLHIKRMGDGQWSDRLVKAAENGQQLSVGLEGPYGALSINIKAYTSVACFAGGIGITPFSHLLEMLITRKDECFPNVSKLIIVWSVQKMSQSACFDQLLEEAERWRGSAKIQILVHATRENKEKEMQSVTGQGVVQRKYGRPDIESVLQQLTDQGQNSKACCALGCGPAALVQDMREKCRRMGVHTHTETFLI